MLSALFISEKISFTFAGMHSIYYSPLFNKQGSPNDDKKLEGGVPNKMCLRGMPKNYIYYQSPPD